MSQTAPNNSSSRETLAELFPNITLLRLGISWAVVVALAIGGNSWPATPIQTSVAAICFVVIFATILLAAFGVVREGDLLAQKLGEPYGTLVLTLSIVFIEVILIAAVMMGPGDIPTIGRDSIFAVMMIILNLVIGICLLLGGRRYGEQEYNSQGAIAYISMILLLTATSLVLPNVVSTGNGSFLPAQAISIAVLTVVLYAGFLAMQMGRYRRIFIQPEAGCLTVPARLVESVSDALEAVYSPPSIDRRAVAIRSIILIALMVPIVVLAHNLAVVIDLGIQYAGVPVAVGGVVIAIIVFTPESITAVRAAFANQMQRVLNLCLGAFLSTVGLTVPAILAISLVTGKTVTLGLSGLDSVLLVITIALSTLTFIGVRTSPIQGMIHLALFAIYAVLLFMP